MPVEWEAAVWATGAWAAWAWVAEARVVVRQAAEGQVVVEWNQAVVRAWAELAATETEVATAAAVREGAAL